MAQLVPPSYEERVLVVGSNGSGKTVFGRVLLGCGYRRWVVVDLKGNFKPPQGEDQDYTIVYDPRDRRLVEHDRVLYRPAPQFRTREWLEYAFSRLYYRAERAMGHPERSFIVVVDETLSIAKKRATEWLAQIAIVTREWGCGLWCFSQRTKWIPVEVRSEAWRLYAFYLQFKSDELEVLDFGKDQLTLEELRERTHSHRFVELRRGEDTGGVVQVAAYPPVRLPTTPRR